DHATTAPSGSVIVMIVLLKEAWMCAYPWCTIRFSPRFLNAFFLAGLPAPFLPVPSGGADASIGSFLAIIYIVFFFATAPLRGPLRVRALVLVRWPRTGRLRRCRRPR